MLKLFSGDRRARPNSSVPSAEFQHRAADYERSAGMMAQRARDRLADILPFSDGETS
jgi:hypothetical protein